MSLPNLLVIGAQKCGTSALHRHLDAHPDVFMSPVKEPKFFALDGRAPDFRGAYPPRSPMITNLADYEALFDGARGERIRGESSTWYMVVPGAAERIEKHLADVKLVAVLRDPVERAFSNFLGNRDIRIEPIASFAEALAAEPERRRSGFGHPWHYLEKSFYHRQLAPFFARFGAERIHVLLHADLLARPEAELRRLFRFLDVDPDVPIDPALRANPSGSRADRWLRRVAPRAWRRRHGFPRSLEARLRGELAPDVAALEALLGRDLSAWRRPEAA